MHHSVGFQTLDVADPQLRLTFPLLLFYPTDQPARPERLGPYELALAREAPLRAGRLPLLLLSHGTGSTPLAYRELARRLAGQGYVVGLPEHPGNNRNDNSWQGTIQNLEARPRHLQLAIDSLLAHPHLGPSLRAEAVGLIGHSMGGYAVLALAGGVPTSLPAESADGQERLVPTPHDERVRGLVLLAPATPWFRQPGALAAVQVPVLLLSAEHDEHTTPWHTEVVLRGLPDPARVQHRVVANAGHFSFLSPFPPAMTRAEFAPSQDPPGFDREAFQRELAGEVGAFFREVFL